MHDLRHGRCLDLQTPPSLPPPGRLRRFAVANLVNTVGSGLYITGGTLYLVAGVALTVDTAQAYTLVVAGNSLLFLVAAVLPAGARVSHRPAPTHRPSQSRACGCPVRCAISDIWR
ncbi:hypothetical protein [Streptomyces sp. NBC_01443]|uniref:hypothetical protein n=1 Tax=Streptomyces sp. NBC_01443 TaxID=2903868 RepID=UPI00224DA395|nr:hypothetical protein [Streptomyces sp. NBC_01443]MCX4632352.1 hypothetical protein [Streptomyces sp. NBC_01443]